MNVLINAGCGPAGVARLPRMFSGWQQIRVDLDPEVRPDIIASITNLSSISDNSANALWSAHCLEHLYAHEVGVALKEFYRVLDDDGFACVVVPDLQAIAHFIATDRLHESVYTSAAGPVTAHDIIYGHGVALSKGHDGMAHHCGFTPTLMMQCLKKSPFQEIVLRRRSTQLELFAFLRKNPKVSSTEERSALLTALET